MKIKCKTSVLAQAFQKIKNCSGSGETLPILGSFALTCTKEGLTLVATDLDLSVWLYLEDVQVAEPGSCCVARRFADFLGRVKAEEVVLTLVKNQLALSYSSGSASFPIFPVEDFPEVKFPKSSEDKVASGLLKTMTRVSFVAEVSQDRGLDCVFCGKRIFATDGRRLAYLDFAPGTEWAEPFAVSAAHLAKVSRVFGKDIPLEFGQDKGRIAFCSDNLKLSVRLREQEPPEVEDILGGETKTLCKIERLALLDMLERLVLVKTLGCFRFEETSLKVEVSGEDGEAEEKLKLSWITKRTPGAEQMVIGINLNFMIEALKRMRSKVVEVGLTDAKSPVRLEGEDLKCLVLPVLLDA